MTAEDHSFRRLLTATENNEELFGILGARAIEWLTRTRHSRGAGRRVQHRSASLRWLFGILGAHVRTCGERSFPRWRRGAFRGIYRYSGGELSAFRGHIILYVPVQLPVVDCPLFVEVWEFSEKNRAGYGWGNVTRRLRVASSSSNSSTASPSSRFNLASRRVCCSSCASPEIPLERSTVCVVFIGIWGIFPSTL